MDFIFGKRRRNKTASNDNKTTSTTNNTNESNNDNPEMEPSSHQKTIANMENIAELDDHHDPKRLAIKSGFVSLQERMKRLTTNDDELKRQLYKTSSRVDKVKHAPQFATLHEFFSSQSRNRSMNCPSVQQEGNNSDLLREYKRPKIPVMRLSKSDWNVKCWEDRLSSHKKRHLDNDNNKQHSSSMKSTKQLGGDTGANRLRKPEKQNEVFRGRIEDVAVKLEKVREGVPLDEELYQLALGKRRTTRGEGETAANACARAGGKSHEWTDLLKSELENGTHNSRQLRSQLEASIGKAAGKGLPKSPLGRPVRRMFEDDEDE